MSQFYTPAQLAQIQRRLGQSGELFRRRGRQAPAQRWAGRNPTDMYFCLYLRIREIKCLQR